MSLEFRRKVLVEGINMGVDSLMDHGTDEIIKGMNGECTERKGA